MALADSFHEILSWISLMSFDQPYASSGQDSQVLGGRPEKVKIKLKWKSELQGY